MMSKVNIPAQEKGTSQMLFNHTPTAVSHSFDDTNLTAGTGIVPIIALARNTGLLDLADNRLTVTTTGTDRGANPVPKLATLIIAGMASGADSIGCSGSSTTAPRMPGRPRSNGCTPPGTTSI